MDPKLQYLRTSADKALKEGRVQHASRHIAAAAQFCENEKVELPDVFLVLASRVIQLDEIATVLAEEGK